MGLRELNESLDPRIKTALMIGIPAAAVVGLYLYLRSHDDAPPTAAPVCVCWICVCLSVCVCCVFLCMLLLCVYDVVVYVSVSVPVRVLVWCALLFTCLCAHVVMSSCLGR